jgi:type I restriction enzyme S subunit
MTLELTIAYAVVPLEELIELIIDHRGKTPKKLGGDFTDYGVPAISAIHIKNGQIQWDERERYVSDAMFQKWMPIKLQKDDVLLTSEAPLGETALVPSDEDLVLSQRLFAIRCNKDSLDPTYFKYFLTSSMGQRVLSARASGSTVIGIRQAELLQIEVPHPDIKIQRTIGKILLSLDAKLQANKQLSKTLEDIAQTIFQSWFIDFDPVKGKMSGEKPVGMDAATAALFPDAMKDSELGLIPAGWQKGNLGQILDIFDSRRVPISGAERKKRSGSFPYYGAAGVIDFIDDYLFTGPHVLVGEDGTVITNQGKPIVQYVWGNFWVSNHAHVLKGIDEISVEYLKLVLDRVDISNFITGAVQLKLNQGNLKAVSCLIPASAVLLAFDAIIQPIFEEIRNLSDTSKSLIDIRDSLLPRLISGELQIPEEMLAS